MLADSDDDGRRRAERLETRKVEVYIAVESVVREFRDGCMRSPIFAEYFIHRPAGRGRCETVRKQVRAEILKQLRMLIGFLEILRNRVECLGRGEIRVCVMNDSADGHDLRVKRETMSGVSMLSCVRESRDGGDRIVEDEG